MFGFHLRRCTHGFYSLDGEVGANSTTYTIGDALTVNTGGFVVVAAAGNRIIGVVDETFTTTADNQTVAQRRISFIPAHSDDRYECDASSAVAATNRKQYADLTGATGAQQIDAATVSDTANQFIIWELDPRRSGSTVRVLASIAERQELAYAQA